MRNPLSIVIQFYPVILLSCNPLHYRPKIMGKNIQSVFIVYTVTCGWLKYVK